MAKQYLDKDGLILLWEKIKSYVGNFHDNTKVDKVDGKGLSSNDYTATEKAKLAGIAAGAEVNVNADWSAATGDAAILNKPTTLAGYGITDVYSKNDTDDLLDDKVDKVSGKDLSTNDYTTTEKNKLAGIASGAEVNVQSDWNVTSSSSDAFIKNKPTNVSDFTNDAGYLTSESDPTVPSWAKASNKPGYTSTEITIPTNTDGIVESTVHAALARLYSDVSDLDDDKVDKVSGKGLSTNDYTTNEKNKLAAIAEGAQVNVIETVKVNGTARTVTSKAVDIPVPTKTSDITNDSGFITINDVPPGAAPATADPLVDGTAAVGTSAKFAREDHRHPTDTSRVPVRSSGVGGALAEVSNDGGSISISSQDNSNGTVLITVDAANCAVELSAIDGGGTENNLTILPNGTHISKLSSPTNPTDAANKAYVDSVTGNKADHATTLAGYGITDAYTKTEVDSKVASTFHYKGTKATVAQLPSSGNTVGDVWHVTETSGEYAWDGSAWQEFGSTIDISEITTAEINAICV